ncbi:MAG: ATP synthase subunit I [Candidatus Dormibacteraeota bacterium]|nr:ATP synthase subunit I [Candidatus Dormibacteraeota bacterium]
MMDRPLQVITVSLIGWAALPVAALCLAMMAAGRGSWALGIVTGWLAGSLNAILLALRVSRVNQRSTVAGTLYGAASRFALIGLLAVGAYRLLGASLVGYAIGIALVMLMNVPVSLIWSTRQRPAR